MKLKNFISFCFIFVCFISLCGCGITNANQQTLNISGVVNFQTISLSDVTIKSSTKNYASTNTNGQFNFSATGDKIEIYAEKHGFIFTPKSIIIDKDTTNIVFNATAIEDLDGTLSLSEICITPTSIVSTSDNYLYTEQNAKGLKIDMFYLNIFNKTYNNLLNKPLFAPKSKSTAISFTDTNSIETGTSFNIKFKINAYFSRFNGEYIFSENNISNLFVSKNQTTALLDENNKISYNLYGVNATNNKFSYNICFVFLYTPNI